MDATVSSKEKTVPFKSPKRFLADLDPATTARVIASAADIALIIDDGIVRDIALGTDELSRESYIDGWRGRPWIETVTIESRPKIEHLLRDASAKQICWRQVNHPSHGGADLPIRYTAIQTGESGRVVALGRDLRAVAALQQRLTEAHQELERDYTKLRDAEARYKLIFEMIDEPVLIADADDLMIEAANPSAERILGISLAPPIGARSAGRRDKRYALGDIIKPTKRKRVELAASEALARGRSEPMEVKLLDGTLCEVTITAFRTENDPLLIVRLSTAAKSAAQLGEEGQLLSFLEGLPDALVVARLDQRLLAANQAFINMARLASDAHVVSARLSDFIGRSETDFNLMMSNLKNHGVIRNYSTVFRDRFGGEETVEISGTIAPHEQEDVIGLSIRGVARRLRTNAKLSEELPSSAEQLTDLVGRLPLKEIVRESADLIERLCIEAALELTGDNRASAAEMLGLSRQGLYSKLKRFGLDD